MLALSAGCRHVVFTSLVFAACAISQPQPRASLPPSLPDFNQSSGWLGADGAASIDLGDRRVLWLFGDTFVGSLKPDGGCAEGTKMVNNTIGLQTLPAADKPGAMSFHWGPERDGVPTAWAASPVAQGRDSHWMWPIGGGVLVPDADTQRLVLFFMMMRRRDKSDSIWNFQPHGVATVTVENPHDPPDKWRTTAAPLCDREPAMDRGEAVRTLGWGVVAMPDPDSDDHILIFGADTTRVLDKRLVLARAPRASLTKFGAWEFRTADGWSPREADAATLADRLVDEFSVHIVNVGGRRRFMLTQMEANLGRHLQVRFADHAHGPWSACVNVHTAPEPAQDSRSFVYAGKAHPEISAPPPGDLVMTYCVNHSDFWHVVRNVALYRPRIVHVPWETIEKAGERP